MIKLTEKQKKWIDVIQWVLIVFLVAICIGGHCTRDRARNQLSAEYQREQTYIKIYDSQQIESLKKSNKSLHDSIKNLRNAETAVEIRYRYKHTIDTVYSVEFLRDEVNDSIYHYMADNDTVKVDLDIKAAQLDWVKGEFTINDKFQIINTEEDGLNQLFINHSPNMEITGVDAWHRLDKKKKWYNNFHIGPNIGVGYGTLHNNFDVYVGVGVTYNIW